MAEPGRDNITMVGRLAAIGVGVVIFLPFGELAVRLMGYQGMFDTYSRPSVFWIHDPLLGWVHEPNRAPRSGSRGQIGSSPATAKRSGRWFAISVWRIV